MCKLINFKNNRYIKLPDDTPESYILLNNFELINSQNLIYIPCELTQYIKIVKENGTINLNEFILKIANVYLVDKRKLLMVPETTKGNKYNISFGLTGIITAVIYE